ncbi:MAG: DUF6036 family nucleotidyltransferase [Candidatus Nanoarchaeia archaeon]|nr:DUF6036 family nucleotidyltransferase [Candidatus Nanoarchaeia archaeon]
MALEPLAHEFLSRLNSVIKKKVTVVLIGGSALSTLGLKSTTEDVDIVCRSSEPIVANFCREYLKRYKVKVEFFVDGLFKNIRIKDYLESAYPYVQDEFQNLDIKLLSLPDIILTKISRSLPRDFEDIARVLQKQEISETELDKRFLYLLKNTIGDKTDFKEKYDNFKKLYGTLLK